MRPHWRMLETLPLTHYIRGYDKTGELKYEFQVFREYWWNYFIAPDLDDPDYCNAYEITRSLLRMLKCPQDTLDLEYFLESNAS